MPSYFLVEHDNWSEPRKIFEGPNTNADGLYEQFFCQTIGRDLAAYEAYQRGEDVFEIIRKEREARGRKQTRSPKNDN